MSFSGNELPRTHPWKNDNRGAWLVQLEHPDLGLKDVSSIPRLGAEITFKNK